MRRRDEVELAVDRVVGVEGHVEEAGCDIGPELDQVAIAVLAADVGKLEQVGVDIDQADPARADGHAAHPEAPCRTERERAGEQIDHDGVIR